jgi:hypothetical protein
MDTKEEQVCDNTDVLADTSVSQDWWQYALLTGNRFKATTIIMKNKGLDNVAWTRFWLQ